MARKDHFEHKDQVDLVIDEALFEKIYQQQARPLFRLCCKLIGDRNEAENIIHDIFESLWKRRDSLRITSSPEAYLTQAVKLKTLKYFRDNADRQLCVGASPEENSRLSQDSTEQTVFYNDLKEKIEVLVDRLPNQCRNVYRMSQEEGLNNKQIADVLLISESAVEQHKSKARTFLRKKLTGFQS